MSPPSETASAPIVTAKLPVPEPLTSPVRVIVWSPVLVPDTVASKGTVRTLLFEIDSVPVDAVRVSPFIDVAVATPISGVTRLGLVAKTSAPLPVSLEIKFFNSKDVVAANCARELATSASPVPVAVTQLNTPLPSVCKN